MSSWGLLQTAAKAGALAAAAAGVSDRLCSHSRAQRGSGAKKPIELAAQAFVALHAAVGESVYWRQLHRDYAK
jgi:hypothetical protein